MELFGDNDVNMKPVELLERANEEESNKLLRELTECKNKFTNNYELWLDKYRAKEYSDLLTEEKPTRDILSWIKSWDEITYKKKFEPTKKNAVPKWKGTNEFQSGNNVQNNFKKEIEYTQTKFKIILIAGPPGTGKTTMARVLANHCNYEPIVINASDERTSDKLLLRIYDSTQLDKLKFGNKLSNKEKPTCLILDEIDGAMDGADGKSAIKSIIDFIKYGKVNNAVINKAKKNILAQNNISESALNSNNNNNISTNNKSAKNRPNYDSSDDELEKPNRRTKEDSDNEETKSSNTSSKNAVKRPIICICNDLYSKVLASLRKEALVFTIKADPNKLERRLKEICQKEKLSIEGSVIKNLCKQTNYDIRACINTLQFVSYNHKNSALFKTLSAEKLFMLGSKDITAGLFDIWNKLLTPTPNSTFKSVLNLYNSYGEFEKVNDGLFVNYISNPIPENKNELENRVKLLECLSYDDVITSKIKTSHSYELSKFQAIPGAFAKNKYSTLDRSKNLKFPTLLIEFKKNKRTNKKVLASLKETFDEENTYSKISKSSLVCDILPYVYQLIQPEIREINPELMNKTEIKQLRTCINIMCQFGIKFADNKHTDDEEFDEDVKIYEPDLRDLLNFSVNVPETAPWSKFKNSQNVTNTQIVSEVKNTRITRKQKFIIRGEFERVKNYKEHMKESKPNIGIGLPKLALPVQEVDAIKEKVQQNNKINFFDPISKKIEALSDSNSSKGKVITFGKKRNYTDFSEPEYKFIYKFNEGVTNTVRRNLHLNYFLAK